MLRYVIFGGLHFHPSGGCNDVRATGDTLSWSKDYASELLKGDKAVSWVQVLDIKTLEYRYREVCLNTGKLTK